LATVDQIVDAAKAHVGYRSLELKNNIFGPAGQDWNGAFVRSVFAECGVRVDAVSTVHILETGYLRPGPRPGDIAVFAFPASGQSLGQPHVGIVTETHLWKPNGQIKTVEGQVSSGLPQGDQNPNGVWERNRYNTDVIGFIRPDLRRAPIERPDGNGEAPAISVSQIRPGHRHRSVEYVQRALGSTVGLRDVQRGLYDDRTRSALAAYQRSLGRTGEAASGVPDTLTLLYLGAESQEFTLRS
jgi:hypothetical protein